MKWIKYWQDKKDEIKKYCDEHNISSEKLWKLDKAYSSNFIVFAIADNNSDGRGLYNDIPGEAVLLVEKGKHNLTFTATKAISKILL